MAKREGRGSASSALSCDPQRRPRRVLGYARVSSEMQARGASLGAQQDSMRAHAAKLGVEVARFYVEAESSLREKYEHREQMQALLRDVREGDLVLADKLDRWSRDPEFTYRSIREILERGAGFYAVSDQCDPATRDGDTMLNFRVMFAREEHKRIRERTVGNRQALRDAGYYTEGLPPLGYRRALGKGERGPEKKNALVIVEADAAKVRQVFRLCITGRSLNETAQATGLSRDRIAGMLRCRTYLGEVQTTRGEWIRARFDAIVDADTFARAQTALAARRLGATGPKGEGETSTWILRDVARCDHCGARMAAAYAGAKVNGVHARHYYRCARKCTKAHVNVRTVEAYAEPLVVARLGELRAELAHEPVAPVVPIAADRIAEQRTKLADRRARAADSYELGAIDRAALIARLAKLDAEAVALDAEELAATKPSPLADEAKRRATLAEVSNIARAWGRAKPAAKRRIVALIAHEARMRAGSPPSFSWLSAAEMVESIA